jgi:kynureninase
MLPIVPSMEDTRSTHDKELSERAQYLDTQDPLSRFRNRFVIEDNLIYLDGNSLGRLPKETILRVRDVVESQWATQLVLGWDTWLDYGTRIGDQLAPIIGANPGEVAIADQTSINLYKLASAAVSSSGRRNILTDRGNFPSDQYVLASVAEAAGGDLVVIPEDPTPGELERHLDPTIGVVSLSHVAFRSGAIADGALITGLVHKHDALMLWDLAHSAGVVPVDLAGWNADLAVGCTYKYLNSGPGAPGFLYVRKDLQTTLDQPITGWFGHADQFGFSQDWQPADDIRRFLVGTPPILSMPGVEVGVHMIAEAGLGQIRMKSIELSSLFIDALEPILDSGVSIVTPRDPHQRGSHVTIRHEHGFQIATQLRQHRVIPDFRAPDLVRFGFAPLYTTYKETVEAALILAEILHTRSFESLPQTRSRVT